MPKLFIFAFIRDASGFTSLNAKSEGTPSIDRLRARSIRSSVSPLTENPLADGGNSTGREYAATLKYERPRELKRGMSSDRVPRSSRVGSKVASRLPRTLGAGLDMFLRIAVYSGRCGCPSGIMSGSEPGGGELKRTECAFGRGEVGVAGTVSDLLWLIVEPMVVARRRSEHDDRWRRTDMRRLRRREGVWGRGEGGPEGGVRGSLYSVAETSRVDIRGVVVQGREGRADGVSGGEGLRDTTVVGLCSSSRFSRCVAVISSRKGCKLESCAAQASEQKENNAARGGHAYRGRGSNNVCRRVEDGVAMCTPDAVDGGGLGLPFTAAELA